jgi:hypothetical protein
MDKTAFNPQDNKLPPGLSAEALAKAVQMSGYPLQTRVAATLLRAGFKVHEEWSFLDGETMRALDVQAEFSRDEWHGELELDGHVYPAVDLLVECKRSDLPYIFFSGIPSGAKWADTVQVAGLRHTKISTPHPTPIASCLGMNGSPLGQGPVQVCSTLSRVQRKGSGLELSGSELFNGVVLPLAKALDHAVRVGFPHPNWTHFEGHLQVPVCVLEAPMVSARTDGAATSLTLTPWVRLIRHEASTSIEGPYDHGSGRLVAIDFVHATYLPTFLTEAVLPTADLFAAAVFDNDEVLVSGCGRLHPQLRACDAGELAGDDEL